MWRAAFFFGGHGQVARLSAGNGAFDRWRTAPGANFLSFSACKKTTVACGFDVATCCLVQKDPLIVLGFNRPDKRFIALYEGNKKMCELDVKTTIAALRCARNDALKVVALYSDNSVQVICTESRSLLFGCMLAPSPLGNFVRPCELSDDGSQLVYAAKRIISKDNKFGASQQHSNDLGIGVLSLNKGGESAFYPLDTHGHITTLQLSPDGNQLVVIDSVRIVSKHYLPKEMES